MSSALKAWMTVPLLLIYKYCSHTQVGWGYTNNNFSHKELQNKQRKRKMCIAAFNYNENTKLWAVPAIKYQLWSSIIAKVWIKP